jgi:urease accessory protein
MFDAISPCEVQPASTTTGRLQRAEGVARIAFRRRLGRTALSSLYQRGATRVRLPRPDRADLPEAVLLNTAGGIAGGDRYATEIELDDHASAIVTTPAAEKIYRSLGPDARVDCRLRLATGARLEYLPQETILFDRARLARRLQIDMAADAELIALEAIVFGRTAMGERVVWGLLVDQWRLRRGGRLVFADTLRLDGPVHATLAGPATGGGAIALATILCAGPRAMDLLDAARAALAGAMHPAGASTWNGLLVVRMAAPDGAALRRTLTLVLMALREGRPLPPVWRC